MGPENGIHLEEVKYFPLEEYVRKIHLKDELLYHMEETNQEFDKYMAYLSNYDEYAILTWFISMFNKEMLYSQEIEHSHLIHPEKITQEDVFFDRLQMSNKRIKDLHKFVTENEQPYDYRKKEVRVSCILPNGQEQIYWKGANPEDIQKFMNDFIALYKKKSSSVLNTNQFFRSALMHLLFVRIHPFSDGNGRTARIIHNMCFTESINKIYGTNLKICPLNLSQSILINQLTYAKRINNIYFDLEHDCNDEINKWFNFMLNMVDEQLYHWNQNLFTLHESFERISEMKNTDTSNLPQIASKQIKKVKKR